MRIDYTSFPGQKWKVTVMKKLSVAFVLSWLLIFLILPPVLAQTKEEGIAMYNEGLRLKNQAQTSEDMKKAVEKYEQALKVYQHVGYQGGIAKASNNLGIVYKSWGQYDKAVEHYEKSLAIARSLHDPALEALCLNNLGNVYESWGQYDKAVEHYEKSLAIARSLHDPAGEAICLIGLGVVYHSWGQYDKAFEYYEKSLAIARSLHDPAGEANSLGSIGNVYESWGQYDKAVDNFEKSLVIFRSLNDPAGEAICLIGLGNVYRSWGQYDKAAEHYEKSLAISREINNPAGESSGLSSLGNVYYSWGQHDKAVEHYEKSLAISREINNPAGESNSLNNLGVVYHSWGQYDKAVEHYEKFLVISRRLKDPAGESSGLSNLGIVYRSWGQYDRALKEFQTSLEKRRDLKDKSGEASSLSSMGLTYAQLGRFDEALTHLQQANAIKAEIGVPTSGGKDNIGNVYLDMGQVDMAAPLIVDAGYNVSLGRLSLLKQDYPKAAEYYEKVRLSAEKNRNSDSLFAAYTGLGQAYENLGDDTAAEENYRKAVDLTEEVRSSLSRDQREKFFDVKVNGFLRTAPYDGLARVRLRMGKTQEALKTSEYTKARIFSESMSKRSKDSTFDLPAEVDKQDKELNNQLSALKKQMQEAYEKGDKPKAEALEPQVKELEAKLQDHIKMLREKYPVFAATKYPQPMDLEQTALKDNEWVLEYHVTDSGIIIYLSKGKQLIKALFKPKPRNDLEKAVLEYRKPLEVVAGKELVEKLASFNLPIGKELSDLLLSDVLDLVPKGASIIIVPDDCLGTIPFEMLTLNDKGSVKTDKAIPYVSDAEFFGDRNLLSYYQSVTALTLARTHSKGKAAKGGLLAIADPVFSEKDKRTSKAPKKEAPTGVWASLLKSLHLMGAEGTDQMGGLKFSRLELTEELADALVKNDRPGSYLCKGFDATKDNFLQNIKPSLKKYDKIVFATHGYFGKDLPGIMEPVLVLTLIPPGTDGFLRMTEVMGLDMNAEIVALTACQSGLGTRVSGEGTMGMGRAFQYAGAKSVLMSLWSVSEVASVRLVKSFFQNLKAGKSKPEALELARSELRKGIWNHPFFWAGFILVGETD